MRSSNLKKLTFAFVILFGFIFIMWGTSPLIAAVSEKKPVKIGLLTPLSPPGDFTNGKRIKWGGELAVKYVNEVMGGVLGGRPVELVVEDDTGTPTDGVAGYRKLVQKDGVVAVMGQSHSSVCLAIVKVSKDLGVPVFSTAASAAEITETQYPTIFSTHNLTPDRSKFWIGFAKQKKWKRVALLAEDTDYGTGFEKWIKKYGTDEGMDVKGIIFPRTASDLTPALLETKAWKPDIVINLGLTAGAFLMVKQAYEIGLFPKVPMLGSMEFPVRQEFWDAVGDKGKYILFSAFYKPGMPVSPAAEWMIPRYKGLTKEDVTYQCLNAFAQILIIAQALNAAQSDDPKALIKALTSGTYQNWSGTVKFEEPPGMKWHNVSPPMLILQETEVRQDIKDSKLVWPPEYGGDGRFVQP